MATQHFEYSMTWPLKTFEMIITPDMEYPMVCVNARKDPESANLKLDLVNLNSSANWFHSDELVETHDRSGKVTYMIHLLGRFLLQFVI